MPNKCCYVLLIDILDSLLKLPQVVYFCWKFLRTIRMISRMFKEKKRQDHFPCSEMTEVCFFKLRSCVGSLVCIICFLLNAVVSAFLKTNPSACRILCCYSKSIGSSNSANILQLISSLGYCCSSWRTESC